MSSDSWYRLASRWLARLLDAPLVGRRLGHVSQVAHRYAAILGHLRTLGFDGVVDGGANIGEFAYLVRRALPAADLVCVEPHPECARVLRRRGFRVVEKALWDQVTELTLSQVSSTSTSSTLARTAEALRTWSVSTVRLDQLEVRGARLLVKLDLQGSERVALGGMGDLWERCAAVLLEVSFGREGSYGPLAQLLEARGFAEYSTVNELLVGGRVVEADKLWLRAALRDSTS